MRLHMFGEVAPGVEGGVALVLVAGEHIPCVDTLVSLMERNIVVEKDNVWILLVENAWY